MVLPDGTRCLFMDTEGLGSTSRSQTDDSRIFALALLLSSTFVWNSRGMIDGNALEDLGVVVTVTKSIHLATHDDGEAALPAPPPSSAAAAAPAEPSKWGKVRGVVAAGAAARASGQAFAAHSSSLAEHFPSFLWVIRDFTLRLEENGRPITDRQYLESALAPQASTKPGPRNQVRQLLKTVFEDRDCLTMVRPAEDESVLRTLSTAPVEALRPEFVAALDALKKKIFGGARPKTFNGKPLNGPLLATLAEAYISSLNSGGAPVIATAWSRVLESQADAAVAAAVAEYDRRLAEALEAEGDSYRAAVAAGEAGAAVVGRLPVDAAALRALHEAALHGAEDALTATAWASADAAGAAAGAASMAALHETVQARLGVLAACNRIASDARCAALLSRLFADAKVRPRLPFVALRACADPISPARSPS